MIKIDSPSISYTVEYHLRHNKLELFRCMFFLILALIWNAALPTSTSWRLLKTNVMAAKISRALFSSGSKTRSQLYRNLVLPHN